MELAYLDRYHLINKSIISGAPVLVKVGVFYVDDLSKFREMYPDSKIIGYEACEANFEKAAREVKSINVRLHNKAVGENGVMEFHIFTNPVSNSVYARHQKDPNCVLKQSTTVKSVDLKTVLKENDLEYIDVLVLNCEGGELPIMHSLSDASVRNKIGQICVSFHDPRIYPTAKKEEVFNKFKQYYHIVRGKAEGIPDYLMIRKV